MTIYTVRPGDSLMSISQAFNVPLQQLQRENGLVSTAVVSGLGLYIPDQGLPIRFYQTRPGDSLPTIANLFRTTPARIQQMNPSIRFNPLAAGQRLRIPSPLRYKMETLGFVIPTEIDKLRALFQAIASELSYIGVFSYSVNADGSLNGVDDQLAIGASKSRGVKPLMVLTNWVGTKFDSALIAQISADPHIRSVLIQNVVQTMHTKGYDGVSVDFEMIPPESRNNFTALIRELKAAMGQGPLLHFNANPKTSDMPTNPLVGGLDYQALGTIVDRMAIMTIEYGYSSGPPNPNAPVWWIEQVIQYAVSQIDRRKVMMAIPFFGNDWPVPTPSGTIAETSSVGDLQNRAIQNQAPIQFDFTAQTATYTYMRNGQQRRVWFDDPRSLDAKYQILELYNLIGVTYWHLNQQFAQNWPYVRKNFRVIKS